MTHKGNNVYFNSLAYSLYTPIYSCTKTFGPKVLLPDRAAIRSALCPIVNCKWGASLSESVTWTNFHVLRGRAVILIGFFSLKIKFHLETLYQPLAKIIQLIRLCHWNSVIEIQLLNQHLDEFLQEEFFEMQLRFVSLQKLKTTN